NFINPTYAVPTRSILAYIRNNQQTGDIIFSESDSGLDFYLNQTDGPTPHFVDHELTKTYIQRTESLRVWLLSLGRDSTRSNETSDLIGWLEQQGYLLKEERGYIEVDPIYREIKSRALGYPAYRHRAVLRLYERP
ncbi:MAG: hypothetical protein GX620_05375, partial [Chloroflexi bacterium]|nr:hypothetical protein [Chloroflexota bacterium]